MIVAYTGHRGPPTVRLLTTKINWRPWVVACCRGLNVHVFIIYFLPKMFVNIYVTRLLFLEATLSFQLNTIIYSINRYLCMLVQENAFKIIFTKFKPRLKKLNFFARYYMFWVSYLESVYSLLRKFPNYS